MKTLLISDLHIDYNNLVTMPLGCNSSFGFEKKLGEYDLVLIAGDTSGGYVYTDYYLKELRDTIEKEGYNTKVCVVGGNHLGYNFSIVYPKNESITKLRNEFSQAPVYFLENDFVDFGKYVVIGCCLYTDFSQNSEVIKNVKKCINDFRFVSVKDGHNIRLVTPQDYIKWYNESVKYIDKICKKIKDKKVIVLTHFMPTSKLISEKYKGNDFNPFFATDLEEIMLKNNNIKLWACGHSHDKNECMVGNTLVTLEPYGYFGESGLQPSEYFGKEMEI